MVLNTTGTFKDPQKAMQSLVARGKITALQVLKRKRLAVSRTKRDSEASAMSTFPLCITKMTGDGKGLFVGT